MQGQYSHGAAYYRCRFTKEYAVANRVEHPVNVYLREDPVVSPLDAWLAHLFSAGQREHTITALIEAAAAPAGSPAIEQASAAIRECDLKLERHRAALEAGADPAVVPEWIAQVQAERAAAHAELVRHRTAPQPIRYTPEQISEMIDAFADAVAMLRQADPEDKAEVYRQLGLRLDYDPETETVAAQARLPWGNHLCPRPDRAHSPTADSVGRLTVDPMNVTDASSRTLSRLATPCVC